jgi:hypothetical protein
VRAQRHPRKRALPNDPNQDPSRNAVPFATFAAFCSKSLCLPP